VIPQSGTFPSQTISILIQQGGITSDASEGIADKQIQPASLDLTLSEEAYQLPGSVLPQRTESVRELVERYQRKKIDLSQPTMLDRNKVYLVRLRESFNLAPLATDGPVIEAYTNNKSSTGRIDLATRTICDHAPRYDKLPPNYQGELWIEIIPKSFDVVLASGVSLNQAIFYRERKVLRSKELKELWQGSPLLYSKTGEPLAARDAFVEDGILMTVDLDQDCVGYVARKTYEPVDLTSGKMHNAEEYFEPIKRPRLGQLYVEKGRFYIFSTAEFIRVPPTYAVEMLPYDTSAGEFRAHYAGFFDPGFGYGLKGEDMGAPAVLEVRAYEDDLIVRHRQPICRMAYEVLHEAPDRLYHASTGASYAKQRGPQLSKLFIKESA